MMMTTITLAQTEGETPQLDPITEEIPEIKEIKKGSTWEVLAHLPSNIEVPFEKIYFGQDAIKLDDITYTVVYDEDGSINWVNDDYEGGESESLRIKTDSTESMVLTFNQASGVEYELEVDIVGLESDGEIQFNPRWTNIGKQGGYYYVNKKTPSTYEVINRQQDRNPIRFVATVYRVNKDGSKGRSFGIYINSFKTNGGAVTARIIDQFRLIWPKEYVWNNYYVKVLRQFKNPKIGDFWIDAGEVEHQLGK
jgi:hypothetical protein